MALVFISYTHSDKEHARAVQDYIEQLGHTVWRDEDEVEIGAPFPERIAHGVTYCDYLVIIITKNSLSSRWMKAELNWFISADPDRFDGRILPLKFDETSPNQFSPITSAVRVCDFSVSTEDGQKELRHALGQSTGAEKDKIADIERLHFAIDLALRAGGIVMRFYNSSLTTNAVSDEKKNASTLADEAAQAEVVGLINLHKQYRRDAIIAEEPPFNNETRVQDKEYTWVIDPLDGTGNFNTKIPFFCSAVGCLRDGKPYIGVVFDPVSNDVYYAMTGLRTQVWNVSRGEVSAANVDQTRVHLNKCTCGTHISGRPDIAARLLRDDVLLEVARNVGYLRAFGSGLLALAYVASGRLQAFFQLDTYIWDQVAGIVLVQNSGGTVIDLSSQKEWNTKTRDVLATANTEIKDSFVQAWLPRSGR